MKTNEEPNAIKNETETVTKKLPELADEDLEQVTGEMLEYIIRILVHDCGVVPAIP